MMTAAAATILDPYGTTMPYPPKSPLKLCYKIGKRNITTHPFHTAILKEKLERFLLIITGKSAVQQALTSRYIKSQKFLLHFVHSVIRSTGSPVGSGAFLSTLYLNTSL